MKCSPLLFFLLLSVAVSAQKTEGMVTYQRVESYTRIISRLSFLSKDEKERYRITWGAEESKQQMKLYFSPTQSLYTYFDDRGQSVAGGYSSRQPEYVITRNFEKESANDLIEMLGQTYLLQDSLRTPVWKIGNQIKEVAGYQCIQATSEDPIKQQKITAWFSQEISTAAGPERYFGLPGLILELAVNEDAVVITATKVEFKNADKELIPPKMKGKKIDEKQYKALIKKHVDDSIKAQRNPYGSLRY